MAMETIPIDDPSPRAFAYPAFRRYYFAAVCSTNGGWISRILISWLAWDMTHSASYVGAVASASLLPVAITGPFFGAITDRMSIRTAYLRVAAGLLAVPLMLLALLALNLLTPTILFCFSLILGTIMAAYHPVRQSLGPRLVDRPAIGSVVALGALNFNIGRLLAPAVGGVLIARFGTVPTAIFGVLLVLPNALVAPTLRPREEARDGPRTSLSADLAEGFRIVWSRWPLRRSILLTISALGLARGVTEILALVADGMFGRGAPGLGLLTSAVGAGALCAAIFQVLAGQRLLRLRALRQAIIWVGFAGILGLVYAPGFEMTLLPAAMIGFTSTYVGVSLQIGIQARLEDELRGRVMSIWMLSNTLSISVFAFTISALTDWIGMPYATTIFVVLSALAVTAITLRPVGD